MTKVISGFPGIGKSHLFGITTLSVKDSDSSAFSWTEEGKRHPDFPANYIRHIQDHQGDVDIILVSSHKVVRNALEEANIPYTVVYPGIHLKDEYMERYRRRGNEESFLHFIDQHWENFLKDIAAETFPDHIILEEDEYLSDALACID